MPPKAASTSSRAKLSSTQEDPEEGNQGSDDDEELKRSLNQIRNRFRQSNFPPSSKYTRTPARVTRSSFARISTPRANIISAQQTHQQEQLDKSFELVGMLGSEVRSAISST